ncbi:MAG: shikimate dehydrogenase [Pseudomonadota bacterium]
MTMEAADPEDPRPRTAGVAGDPIAQSKSPRLFAHWFDVHGIDGHYIPLHIAAQDFRQTVRSLSAAGFRGLNVTVPHKLDALELADARSEAAMAIGAANTLTFRRDGTIHADNTDGYGFLNNLKAGAPDWSAASGPVAMLGAGGAARAAIHVLLQAGTPEIRLMNRTREKAEALAEHFGTGVEVIDWAKRSDALDGCGTIVNTTSLGMIGKPPLEISLDAASPGTLVTDMVYNPLTTDLLRQANDRNLLTVDGLGMLLHQARPGFTRWFGPDPDVTPALREACLAP